MDTTLRIRAAKAAKAIGFSSLQETVRLFLHRLAAGAIHLELTTLNADEYVSPKALARYDKMEQNIKSGKVKTTVAHSVKELMEQLNGTAS